VASRGHRVDGGEVSSGGATWEAEDRRGSAKSEWQRERAEVSRGVDGQVFRIRSTKRATRGASRACIRAVYFWTSRRGLGAHSAVSRYDRDGSCDIAGSAGRWSQTGATEFPALRSPIWNFPGWKIRLPSVPAEVLRELREN